MKVLVVHETPLPSGPGGAKVLTGRILRQLGATEIEFMHLSGEKRYSTRGRTGKYTYTAGPKKVKVPGTDTVYETGWHLWFEDHREYLQTFDKVIPCGGVALAACLDWSSSKSILAYRGRGYVNPDNIYMVPTLSPTTVTKDSDYFRDFAADLQKGMTRSQLMPQNDDYTLDCYVADSITEVKELLSLLSGASVLSCDVETTGFSPKACDLLSVGLCAIDDVDNATGLIIPAPLLEAAGPHLRRFFAGYQGKIVFHNAKFDLQHLHEEYGILPINDLQDTMLMHYALDERPSNRYKNHGLKKLSRIYFDAPDYEVAMGPWIAKYHELREGLKCKVCGGFGHALPRNHRFQAKDPSVRPALKEHLDHMHYYQFLDCWYTTRLYFALETEMAEEDNTDGMWRLLNELLYPATRAFAEIERAGVNIDVPYFENMQRELKEQLSRELEEIRKQVFELTGVEEFNPDSPAQVKKVLYHGIEPPLPKIKGPTGRYAWKRESGSESSDKDVLKALAKLSREAGRENIAGLINSILSYRQRNKILGTYVQGLLDRLDVDGRVRAQLNLHGTSTGRLSASNPNLQNIPDASHVGFDIRKGYIADPGHVIIEADYSQLELRVAALFSQDEDLLRTYREDRDIHQEVAYILWNKPKEEVTKYERYLAKCLNFGVVYGRGPRSIATGPEMEHLEEMGGARWSPADIEDYFNKFLAGYPGLVEYIAFRHADVRARGYCETPFGNRRRFPFISKDDHGHVERQGLNSPIQGFASHVTLSALVRIHNRFISDGIEGRILFPVHDSIMATVKKSQAKKASRIFKEEMEDDLPTLPGVDWTTVPFKADVEIKPRSWGDKTEED